MIETERISQIKRKDEKILYHIKPKRLAYTIGSPIVFLVGIFWFLFDLNFIKMSDLFRTSEFLPSSFSIGIFIFIVVHLTPFWYAIFSPFYRWVVWKKVDYYITTERIYILVKKNTSIIELKQLSNVDVKITFIENLFGVGTINFPEASSGNNYSFPFDKHGVRFKRIESPYEVYNQIMDIIKRIEKKQREDF